MISSTQTVCEKLSKLKIVLVQFLKLLVSKQGNFLHYMHTYV